MAPALTAQYNARNAARSCYRGQGLRLNPARICMEADPMMSWGHSGWVTQRSHSVSHTTPVQPLQN